MASAKSSEISVFSLSLKVFAFLVLLFFLFIVFPNNLPLARFVNSILLFVQFVSFLVFAFFMYKVFTYTKYFKKVSDEIGGIYSQKYSPKNKKEESSKTIYEKKMQIISDHIYSANKSEWKLAIIELDTILKDILTLKGYEGQTIAEQLEEAKKRPFGSLENAWEAHKVRNQIAHQGMSFELTQREAERVFKLYKTVFQEFEII